MASSTKDILLRLPLRLAEDIRRVAETERRSTNGQIIIAIEQYLAKRTNS